MAFVYLIEDQGSDNYFKIGVTRGDMEKRLKKLQTGNGNEIRMHRFYEMSFFQLEKCYTEFGNARKKGMFEMHCDDIINFRDNVKMRRYITFIERYHIWKFSKKLKSTCICENTIYLASQLKTTNSSLKNKA